MKIFKRILFIILAVIALPFLIALFVPKSYTVEREITINKPKTEVFAYIKFLKNQDNFSRWASMDPEMMKTYKGEDGQTGFVSAWESKDENVGSGEQEITSIQEGVRIDYEIRFIKPFKSVSKAYLITEETANNQTQLKWGFYGHIGYPLNIMLLFMNFDKMIGQDFEIGLKNLKQLLEQNQ